MNKLKKYEAELEKQGKPLLLTQYTVKQGDSLWSIASKFDLDLDTIIGSNKISNINYLRLGTVLRIPNQDGIFVTVGKNDTVAKLADKHGSYTQRFLVGTATVVGCHRIRPESEIKSQCVGQSRPLLLFFEDVQMARHGQDIQRIRMA